MRSVLAVVSVACLVLAGCAAQKELRPPTAAEPTPVVEAAPPPAAAGPQLRVEVPAGWLEGQRQTGPDGAEAVVWNYFDKEGVFAAQVVIVNLPAAALPTVDVIIEQVAADVEKNGGEIWFKEADAARSTAKLIFSFMSGDLKLMHIINLKPDSGGLGRLLSIEGTCLEAQTEIYLPVFEGFADSADYR